jgi:hypothetical protein
MRPAHTWRYAREAVDRGVHLAADRFGDDLLRALVRNVKVAEAGERPQLLIGRRKAAFAVRCELGLLRR